MWRNHWWAQFSSIVCGQDSLEDARISTKFAYTLYKQTVSQTVERWQLKQRIEPFVAGKQLVMKSEWKMPMCELNAKNAWSVRSSVSMSFLAPPTGLPLSRTIPMQLSHLRRALPQHWANLRDQLPALPFSPSGPDMPLHFTRAMTNGLGPIGRLKKGQLKAKLQWHLDTSVGNGTTVSASNNGRVICVKIESGKAGFEWKQAVDMVERMNGERAFRRFFDECYGLTESDGSVEFYTAVLWKLAVCRHALNIEQTHAKVWFWSVVALVQQFDIASCFNTWDRTPCISSYCIYI